MARASPENINRIGDERVATDIKYKTKRSIIFHQTSTRSAHNPERHFVSCHNPNAVFSEAKISLSFRLIYTRHAIGLQSY